jgi:hypothetical protein
VVLSLGACLPSSPPPTLLTEDFEVIGLRMEVVEPGPLSTDLLPIPADRVRSEALPGDRIRLTALVANEDGELDLGPLEPRWLLASGAYLDVALDSIEPCDPSQPLLGGASCDAGTGASIELTVQDLAPDRPVYRQETNVLFVVGVVVPTEECLERLMSDASQLSLDCMVGRRSLSLGPAPRVVELMREQGIPLDDDDGFLPLELPPLTIELAPNFAPRTPWLRLSRPGEVHLAWPGERAELPAGAAFDLVPAVEGRDGQDYLDLGPGGFSIRSESSMRMWHTTAPVLVNRGARLQVPDEAGSSFTVFVVTTDSRESQTWSIFDFDVVSP